MKKNDQIQKAKYFAEKWLSSLLENNKEYKKEILHHSEKMKIIQKQWKRVLSSVFGKDVAEILEKNTTPVNFNEETLYIKVSQADENFLIINNKEALLLYFSCKEYNSEHLNITKIEVVFPYAKI